MKDTRVITVAHWLKTISDYVIIMVMKQGQIVEIGTPFDLMEKNVLVTEKVQHTGKMHQ